MTTTGRPAAIVTGASSGIGAASARLLAERGYDLGLTYRGEAEGAARTAAEVEERGGRAVVAQMDFKDPAGVTATMETLVAELGRIDALVNNAGANRRQEMDRESAEGLREALDVNLVGPCLCAKVAAVAMERAGNGGAIVNVSSCLAFAPLEAAGAYCAAKAGLEMATKVMALEWASKGIRVNAVAPGHAATPMNYDAETLDGSRIDRPVIPLARAAEAEEIAAAIVFLAAAESSYVTGASILVDGGLLLPSGPTSLQRATGKPPEKG
ncbi:MAG: SDR family oxidoreductase [Actinobacteria bacterium]|nr:SDR family oxidoreductase [Actinomycetota bacterium]